jgi:hypothetical protein
MEAKVISKSIEILIFASAVFIIRPSIGDSCAHRRPPNWEISSTAQLVILEKQEFQGQLYYYHLEIRWGTLTIVPIGGIVKYLHSNKNDKVFLEASLPQDIHLHQHEEMHIQTRKEPVPFITNVRYLRDYSCTNTIHQYMYNKKYLQQ